jgi:glycerol-3-phosphate dehydrogenase subunit C
VFGKDADADALSRATLDLSEYLMKRHAAGKLETDFPKAAGRIAYHVACHLKVQDIGFKSRDLLALVPGNHVETIEKCSGHDGTWSMKTEYFPMSMEIGKPLFEKVRETAADAVVTDCPLAGLQISQGAGVSPRHPIQILADCYGLEV